MNPSWYDVLGVDHDAGADEIRAAWKDSIADLDPSDRRFRQRNRAAETLLDPDRRAAHDAELAASEPDDDPDDVEPVEPDEPDDDAFVPPGSAVVSLDKPGKTDQQDEPVAEPASAATPDVPGAQPPRGAVLVAAVLGLVAVLLAGITVLAYTGDDEGDESGRAASSASNLPAARDIEAAVTAAEAAIGPVLSFDYRNLEQSKEAAVTYMTPEFAEEYRANFEGYVLPNAPTTQTIVTTELVASGVVRTGVDRVDVLLFVNQPTRNREGDDVYRVQVTARMVQADGTWLVGCLIDQPGAKCDA